MRSDLCERCQKRPRVPAVRLFGPPNLCSVCRDTMFSPCSRQALDVRLGWSLIPCRYKVIDASNPCFSRVLPKVDEAWEQNKGILVEGPVGCGKTLMSSILLRRLVERGVSCYFVSVPEYTDSLRKGKPLISVERLKYCGHLFLDDLGAEYDKSGWWFSILYEIVNHRYANNKLTSATCNQFRVIEPRVLRRIAETDYVLSLERK